MQSRSMMRGLAPRVFLSGCLGLNSPVVHASAACREEISTTCGKLSGSAQVRCKQLELALCRLDEARWSGEHGLVMDASRGVDLALDAYENVCAQLNLPDPVREDCLVSYGRGTLEVVPLLTPANKYDTLITRLEASKNFYDRVGFASRLVNEQHEAITMALCDAYGGSAREKEAAGDKFYQANNFNDAIRAYGNAVEHFRLAGVHCPNKLKTLEPLEAQARTKLANAYIGESNSPTTLQGAKDDLQVRGCAEYARAVELYGGDCKVPAGLCPHAKARRNRCEANERTNRADALRNQGERSEGAAEWSDAAERYGEASRLFVEARTIEQHRAVELATDEANVRFARARVLEKQSPSLRELDRTRQAACTEYTIVLEALKGVTCPSSRFAKACERIRVARVESTRCTGLDRLAKASAQMREAEGDQRSATRRENIAAYRALIPLFQEAANDLRHHPDDYQHCRIQEANARSRLAGLLTRNRNTRGLGCAEYAIVSAILKDRNCPRSGGDETCALKHQADAAEKVTCKVWPRPYLVATPTILALAGGSFVAYGALYGNFYYNGCHFEDGYCQGIEGGSSEAARYTRHVKASFGFLGAGILLGIVGLVLVGVAQRRAKSRVTASRTSPRLRASFTGPALVLRF